MILCNCFHAENRFILNTPTLSLNVSPFETIHTSPHKLASNSDTRTEIFAKHAEAN